jgi:hypothetical protein
MSAVAQGAVTFFQYKNQLSPVDRPDNGGISKLYMNGYRFVAAAGSDQSKLVSGLTLTENELEDVMYSVLPENATTRIRIYRKNNIKTQRRRHYIIRRVLNSPDNTSEFVIRWP